MWLLVAAALAVEPLLGAGGWTWLGPLPPGRDPARDVVVFDPASCAVEVSKIDLDGGPEARDLRLHRVWTAEGWRWADDWRVVDGWLLRPGRVPVAVGTPPVVGEEALEVDAGGWVVARSRPGRRLVVERDARGRWTGMGDGLAWVRLIEADGETWGQASDGRKVAYRWSEGRLLGVGDPHGVRTSFTYDGDRLVVVSFADATLVHLDGASGRVDGAGGRWSCRAEGSRTVLVDPGGGSWVVERRGDAEVVVDPAQTRVTLYRGGGRITGWADPSGGQVRVTRDAAGRILQVDDARAGRPVAARGEGLVTGWTVAAGERWTVRRGVGGAVVEVADPAGRRTGFTTSEGRLDGWSIAGATWTRARDRAGKVVRETDPTGGRLELRRDELGRVGRVVDGAGGEWTLTRDPSGRVVRVTDPAGAEWRVGWDRAGRPHSVLDPTGLLVRWTRGDDGRLRFVERGEGRRWELLRGGAGYLTGLRDPLGRLWGWRRDGAGRLTELRRGDGTSLRVQTDSRWNLGGVGPARVFRDDLGAPVRIEVDGRALRGWTRDGAGRVVEATAPGIRAVVQYEPGGAVRAVRAEGVEHQLVRDAAGRVRAVEGAEPLVLDRDALGRPVRLTDGEGSWELGWDLRGLVSRLRRGGREWRVRRDAAGRSLGMEAVGELTVGVDRDRAGRPSLVRFPDGSIARLLSSRDGVGITLEDPRGRLLAEGGWGLDALGRLAFVRGDAAWRLQRDPLDRVVAVEAETAAWSAAPGRVEGPDGALVELEAGGRPRRAVIPEGAPPAWGTAERAVEWVLDAHGAMEALVGEGFSVGLAHDGLGRLVAWETGGRRYEVDRDAFGRVTRVGNEGVLGWEGILGFGAGARAGVAGVVVARPGGGVLYDPRGVPLFVAPLGRVDLHPGGLPRTASTGEVGAGGRLQPFVGGPLIGAVTALDPLSAQPTGPDARFPWEPTPWIAEGWDPPWPDPDGGIGGLPWDDGDWAPRGAWGDPLRILVEAGELEDGGPRGARPAGLPWLPSGWSVEVPAPIPDARAAPLDEEPIVRWVLRHARAPVRPADPPDLAAFLLTGDRAAFAELPPSLRPPLPPELAP